ncbi:hypothetical protein N7528_002932 [Penicillium herquei]|nr:hypothetical protein N7528_002932 [Penicillium herquei]
MSGLVNTGAHAASGSGGQLPGGDDRRPKKKRPLTAEAQEAERARQRAKRQRKRQREAEGRRQAASGQGQDQQSDAEPTELSAAIQAACQLTSSSDNPLFHPIYWLRRGFQLGVTQRIASQGGSQGSDVHQEANTAFDVAMEEALSTISLVDRSHADEVEEDVKSRQGK